MQSSLEEFVSFEDDTWFEKAQRREFLSILEEDDWEDTDYITDTARSVVRVSAY